MNDSIRKNRSTDYGCTYERAEIILKYDNIALITYVGNWCCYQGLSCDLVWLHTCSLLNERVKREEDAIIIAREQGCGGRFETTILNQAD